ncbi:SLBB domain-containing protein [Pseudoalteromonas shioyasakiensis]|uniref:SLBB domain-containing protein n=1 Tax=Pseudoalteromonas shioyasakiensis TaxID=1190813 RepID=A0ABT6U508_9GAMM|nr:MULTISPECIES: SLBB domain-containing protein [Pseudoalteromonas]MDI4671246.1 SLBB domain-containing protein [Pseudoalteromonas shioyasakiensis]MDI4673373.1 SLBB domain-containing protein [Pseudoalteromonas shioyasakiensis]MDI4688155.1 SLBB domain-containing protein [Pseudoalteromonas shioyasakiensis]MDI4706751.1 SLBB domain-containing protein [Pseudoalteromonas shioyasakiensis]NUJ23467.1 SLBB domain-containing protein [Pseudoalteromonas sp. 0802]
MLFKRLFITFLLLTSASVLAFTPTAAQIEQFKKLPRAQQEALARQYGVDLSTITGKKSSTEQIEQESTIQPRLEQEKEQLTDEERFAPKVDEVKPFGYDLFAGEPTSFMPSENAAVPDTYLIGRGDTLNINFYGKESESYEVVVDREGRISIPNLSPVQVAGLTFAEVKELIKAKVEQEVIGIKAFVSVGKLRSIRVLVLGEAYKPGSYSVSSLTTVSHALFVSGGVSDIASLRNIQVKRAGKVVANFDLYDLLINGDSSNDIILKPGDVVFIPSVGSQVAVEGLVKRPAIFELKKGETAAQLLKMAGGLKPQAYAKKAIVERFNNNNMKEVLSIDFSGNQINYTPRDGDRIRFNPVSFQYQNSISLIGAVARPGHYQWHQGKHISDVLTSVRGDLLPQADLGYGLLVREVNVAGDIQVFQFDIAQAIVKAAEHDLELKANDKLFVFSRYQEKQAEESALANMALTEEQQQQQYKVKQWHEYQQREFEKYIGVTGTIEDLKLNEDSAKSIADIAKHNLNKDKELLDPKDYAVFSRFNLLKPIISKLKQQASVALAMQLVEINGHVTYPGVYPLTVNGEVNDLIAAAGGLLESAYTEQAEITRVMDGDASKVKHIKFNLQAALLGSNGENIALRSKDSINIFSIPNWQENVKVELKGEVKFPGIYTIRRGETLSNLLERAGGFSEFAAPNAAIFTREAIRKQEQQQLAKLSEDLRRDIASKSFENSVSSNSLSYDEMNKLLNDLASVEAVGRLVIDLPLIVEDKQRLVLQNGDALYVPSKRDSISVIGEVNYATSHLFKKGITVDDYIDLSGGLKERAADERIYIIKANGSVKIPSTGSWFAVNDANTLEAGDTIVVPMNADYMDNLTLWSTATQIVYQLGVAVAAISSI